MKIIPNFSWALKCFGCGDTCHRKKYIHGALFCICEKCEEAGVVQELEDDYLVKFKELLLKGMDRLIDKYSREPVSSED